MGTEHNVTHSITVSVHHPRQQWVDERSMNWFQWDWFWSQLQPRSIFGREYKERILPYTNGEEEAWLREVELSQKIELLTAHIHELRFVEALQQITDPRPLCSLIAKGESGHEADWFTLKRFIRCALPIIDVFEKVDAHLREPKSTLQDLQSLLGQEEQSLSLEGLNPTLADLKREFIRVEAEIQHQRAKCRQQTEAELSPFHIRIQQDRQIYLSLHDTKALEACLQHPALQEVQRTPFEVIFQLVTASEEEQLVYQAQELQKQIDLEEQATLERLAQGCRPHLEDLDKIIHALGEWEWRLTKWHWKQSAPMVWPTLSTGPIRMQAGRFLPLEQKMKSEGRSYTPVSVAPRYGCTVVTGMNMGGKSVTLKTLASLTLLAHYALPLPADQFQTPLLKRMKVISDDLQSVQRELSTFGAEMHELVQHWQEKDQLLILDELARGTNPVEGEALVYAIANQLAQKQENIAVLVTHFTFLRDIPEATFYLVGDVDANGAINYAVRQVEQTNVPNQALFIARRMGLPQAIIAKAQSYLSSKQQTDENRNRGK